ncbi:aldo/keto reductase [Paenibacillus polymyxa]|jgi:aryl-alcohol dehydrogenase-like predicted oxidoreductase|uniref:aldo/keto reductase n=1 Tax=Paenibacillus TaxID=44249 RepID=UPI0003036AE9|nr:MULTISPECIES: aldo/keto reductase [Paenibacillus]AHM65809.1 oxidoreductase yrpg [Paenibacillus polymyxa SQR-21]AIY11296.1 oxidoreductase [Paenibacillus polymyxa]AJE49823.1 oxidoreductase [Paenibacillus polymyxa]AUS26378.1 oxidoreductase [Paenibacillus polymyxa]AZH29253.1 aldo/keto reductase [Paenibacillus sp. M-152]
MEYSYLGKSGLKVSRLCLGTMNFGPETEEKDAFKIMDAALDAGINFFDTANVYGHDRKGWTEEIIGRWFQQGGGRREKVVLATKVYGDMKNENDGPNAGSGLSAYKIRRHLDASLKRLQTDHIELYQMHHIDRNVSWDELWGVFESVVDRGQVGYIGSSNFAGWHIAVAQAEAKARRFLGLVSEQHLYNLNERSAELEVLPAAQELGLGVIPWSPLAGGLLGRNALAGTGSRSARAKEKVEQNRAKLEQFAALSRELGEKEDVIALAWVLSHPAVTAPIIGPRTLEQLEDALRVPEVKLSEDVLAKLDEIFPGPGKPAPEAYAW